MYSGKPPKDFKQGNDVCDLLYMRLTLLSISRSCSLLFSNRTPRIRAGHVAIQETTFPRFPITSSTHERVTALGLWNEGSCPLKKKKSFLVFSPWLNFGNHGNEPDFTTKLRTTSPEAGNNQMEVTQLPG
jgi:hypothetical protein